MTERARGERRDRITGAIGGIGALVLFLWVGSARIDGFWASWPYLVLGAAFMAIVRSWAYWSRSAFGTLIIALTALIPSLAVARAGGLGPFAMYIAGSMAVLGTLGYLLPLRPLKSTGVPREERSK
ncbi:MAG TPA: hypothetical protein VGA16_11460 [Candidatus Limnocylindria bacterium]